MTHTSRIPLLSRVTFRDGSGVVVGRAYLPQRGRWAYDVAIGGIGGAVACFDDGLVAHDQIAQVDAATGATPRPAVRPAVRLQHVRGAA